MHKIEILYKIIIFYIIYLFLDLLKIYCQHSFKNIKKESQLPFDLFGLGKQYLKCQLIKLLKKQHNSIYLIIKNEKIDKNNFENNFSSLKWLIGGNCKLNKTFGFLAIDKRFGNYFMKKWGNEEELIEKDSFALISMKDEKIYWLKEGTEENLNMLVFDKILKKYLKIQ